MKKALKRILAAVALFLCIAVSGCITILFFPQPLFAYKHEHKQFRVYSSEPVDDATIDAILDDAYELVIKSELHDPGFRFDVFLAHNHFFNSFEDLQGKGPVARATAGNITIKVPIDASKNLALSNRSTINLTELVCHEMIHVLQAHRYGLINFSPVKHPPLWKLEGYPEYISRNVMLREEKYNLKSEIIRYERLVNNSKDGFVEVTEDHFAPAYYYKGRLMIEYLIDIKGLTYDAILSDTLSEDEVYQKMNDWSESEPFD
jgi:hypothetical protein